jgi:hypothetical protein
MKQKILEALKAKFQGVSDTILNRIAEKMAKTVTTEEGVEPAVEGVTFQQIIESEADRRATDATQTAVTNYEKKHGLKDGQKVETEGATKKDEPDKPDTGGDKITAESIAAAVAAAIKPLSEEINALKTGKVVDERKTKLEAVIGKLPETLKKPYSRMSVKDMTDDEFDTLITDTTAEVDELLADITARGSVLKTPMGGGGKGGKEPSKDDTAKVVNGII